jgi:hypothetical protein
MNTHARPPPCYVFDFPRLDTVVAVEPSADRVVIRASRNSFSADRKACFIRELAAEGFIGEEYGSAWFSASGAVRWIVDAAGFMPDAAHLAATRRFMLRLLGSAMVSWLLLMGVLLAHQAG